MAKKHEYFGKYIILDKLAAGGMAEVFLARAPSAAGAGRFVALKRILPRFSKDVSFGRMFEQEARIALQLLHGNIVPIYEFGLEQNQYYLCMGYVHGRNLRQVLKKLNKQKSVLPAPFALYIAREVAGGLEYAHGLVSHETGQALDIIHRDMSPHNVMLDLDGSVKIIDFGIAKAHGQTEKTQHGALKGKFSYMSPEQVNGHAPDRRSDVFSLGIVLWEMLTGQRLFLAKTEVESLKKVQACQVPSLSDMGIEVGEEVEAVLQKALAKDCAHRYQSAGQLQADLNKYMNQYFAHFRVKEFSEYLNTLYVREAEQMRNLLVEYAKIPFASQGPLGPKVGSAARTSVAPVSLKNVPLSDFHKASHKASVAQSEPDVEGQVTQLEAAEGDESETTQFEATLTSTELADTDKPAAGGPAADAAAVEVELEAENSKDLEQLIAAENGEAIGDEGTQVVARHTDDSVNEPVDQVIDDLAGRRADESTDELVAADATLTATEMLNVEGGEDLAASPKSTAQSKRRPKTKRAAAQVKKVATPQVATPQVATPQVAAPQVRRVAAASAEQQTAGRGFVRPGFDMRLDKRPSGQTNTNTSTLSSFSRSGSYTGSLTPTIKTPRASEQRRVDQAFALRDKVSDATVVNVHHDVGGGASHQARSGFSLDRTTLRAGGRGTTASPVMRVVKGVVFSVVLVGLGVALFMGAKRAAPMFVFPVVEAVRGGGLDRLTAEVVGGQSSQASSQSKSQRQSLAVPRSVFLPVASWPGDGAQIYVFSKSQNKYINTGQVTPHVLSVLDDHVRIKAIKGDKVGYHPITQKERQIGAKATIQLNQSLQRLKFKLDVQVTGKVRYEIYVNNKKWDKKIKNGEVRVDPEFLASGQVVYVEARQKNCKARAAKPPNRDAASRDVASRDASRRESLNQKASQKLDCVLDRRPLANTAARQNIVLNLSQSL